MIKLIEAVCKNDGSVIIGIPDTAPTDVKTKFTLLLTIPKNDQWHEFEKKSSVLKYYSSLWTENKIMNVFCKYNKKPKTNDVIVKCNVHDYIDNEGEDLGEKYLEKTIHIHPKPNSASEIMSKALYEKYKKSTKENVVNLIGAATS
ncbi:unnamed protein product [Rhizophagus irregularis]|nr:unnamed protein product [Rhizophagus irregularis]